MNSLLAGTTCAGIKARDMVHGLRTACIPQEVFDGPRNDTCEISQKKWTTFFNIGSIYNSHINPEKVMWFSNKKRKSAQNPTTSHLQVRKFVSSGPDRHINPVSEVLLWGEYEGSSQKGETPKSSEIGDFQWVQWLILEYSPILKNINSDQESFKRWLFLVVKARWYGLT